MANFIHPYRCNNKGIRPQNSNLEYKRSAGAYPLRDFHEICSVCTSFQDALTV